MGKSPKLGNFRRFEGLMQGNLFKSMQNNTCTGYFIFVILYMLKLSAEVYKPPSGGRLFYNTTLRFAC
ncbi:hypothetical protein A2974_03345 [Candidatus Peregrinibacteria bacterium RIFCSPLOWO2_01_FULL_48_20]|nr:MAG: hypothetical protein A2974_03345 [Candidatus Peregrinibacteria bacterium RIFCSPLOWO2_01_FULL_48_20]